MVDKCCAPGCPNARKRGKARAFYRIPKDPDRRLRWINAIKRARKEQNKSEHWEPKSYGFRLCSDHFISGTKSDNALSPDYIPSVFKPAPSPENIQRRQVTVYHRLKERRLRRKKKGKKSSASAVTSPTDCPQDGSKHPPTAQSPNGESTCEIPQPVPDDRDDPVPCETEDCKRNIKSLEFECQALKTENTLLNDALNGHEINEISLIDNNKKVSLLTGLPTYAVLMTVFKFVVPFLKPVSNVTVFQQYMLALIKIRTNLPFDFLAYYFGIDSDTVTELFKHCINVMYLTLVPGLVLWPDSKSLRKSLPYKFRNSTFERTICVIDFFEIFIEKPSNVVANTQSDTTHEPHHKMKYLIAVCPQGFICFISNGWGGRTSDKFITEQSSFLSHLVPGDLVLANRGFNAKEAEQSHQTKNEIEAFTRGKNQLEAVDLQDTEYSTSVRIHISKVIGTIHRKYAVLQNSVPMDFTDIDRENDVTYLDKIVRVCCALANVSESVMPL